MTATLRRLVWPVQSEEVGRERRESALGHRQCSFCLAINRLYLPVSQQGMPEIRSESRESDSLEGFMKTSVISLSL